MRRQLLVVDYRRITVFLSLVVLTLGLINVPLTLAEVHLRDVSWTVSALARCLTLDSENSIPAWFSSGLLFACSAALAVVAVHTRSRSGGWWKHWAGLALIFTAMSIDEAVGFHEMLILPMRRLSGGGLLYFGWVLPGMLFVGAVGLTFLKFVWSLPVATRNRFVFAGGLYVFGALGLEMPGGWLMERFGEADLRYILTASAEELCEMAGLVLFLRGILQHLETIAGRLCIGVMTDASASPAPAAI